MNDAQATGALPYLNEGEEQSPNLLEQMYDPEHPERAVAGAFAGGFLFAIVLRWLRP